MVASERLARSVLEQAVEAMVVCDPDEQIVRASDAAHRLCGGNPLLRPFSEVFPLHVEGERRSIASLGIRKQVVDGLPATLVSGGQTLNLQVSAYEAAVASAEANLALADAELERHRQLLDRKYISQALFDARANQQKAAAAGLEQARAQLEVARNQTTYTQLAADASGVITQIMAEVGQVVSPGQPVAALAHEGELEVAIDVPESRVGEFKPGRVVIAEMWAASGKRYPATIREVSPQADPATRTNAVKVAFDAPDGDVQLGRTARIFLTDAARASSVLVPLSAVHEKDGKPAVYIVDAKTKQVALREVTLGIYREDGATVTGGLAATDWGVANDVRKLKPGQAIKPIDRDNRPVTL